MLFSINPENLNYPQIAPIRLENILAEDADLSRYAGRTSKTIISHGPTQTNTDRTCKPFRQDQQDINIYFQFPDLKFPEGILN
jgi:hypothetical protein